MIENDAIDNIFDLQHRWGCLIDDAWDDVFDYDYFKLLAAHTFTYLFQFLTRGILPRESLSVLFKIKHFATFMFSGISDEFEAAKLVAQAFCDQMEDCWVEIEDDFSEDLFVVAGADGEDYLIDTNSFDLTELVESLSEQ